MATQTAYTTESRALDYAYDPVFTVPGGGMVPGGGAQQPLSSQAAVSGENRFKYFRRPMVPFLNPVPPEV